MGSSCKFIIVTGGVLSGLGKGVAAASMGHLLSKDRKIVPIKLDGYLNVDPGTMNPVEHGEVFVLDDGSEVDMDFGHYERFLDIKCKAEWNLTMGKVFDEIRKKERRGDYLGKTVQYIPHVTGFIKEKFHEIAERESADIMLIEVGGTVGDIETELYIEACRQLKKDVGKENVLYVHLTYVPIPSGVHEQKSKPTQQSVNQLRSRGINPDIIVGRCSQRLTPHVKEKIATFCDIDKNSVITGLDVDNIYDIPKIFHSEGVGKIIGKHFGYGEIPYNSCWENRLNEGDEKLKIAICGKYTSLGDSYASVIEALDHAGANLGAKIEPLWIETTDVDNENVVHKLMGVDGVIVPGGFGSRGSEGKISVIGHCREKNVPFLGLCYGMQLAVVDYARNVAGLQGANSSEIEPSTRHPVIDLLPEQKNVVDKGATMRLGGYDINVKSGSQAENIYGNIARLRFRHRWEVNPEYIEKLKNAGLVFSGYSADERIMQILELPNHKFFMATQAHPELTSKLERPDGLFFNFVKSCLN
jgi:CTP synthase